MGMARLALFSGRKEANVAKPLEDAGKPSMRGITTPIRLPAVSRAGHRGIGKRCGKSAVRARVKVQ